MIAFSRVKIGFERSMIGGATTLADAGGEGAGVAGLAIAVFAAVAAGLLAGGAVSGAGGAESGAGEPVLNQIPMTTKPRTIAPKILIAGRTAGGLAFVATRGAPQWGHQLASELTSFPHSPHFSMAIGRLSAISHGRNSVRAPRASQRCHASTSSAGSR